MSGRDWDCPRCGNLVCDCGDHTCEFCGCGACHDEGKRIVLEGAVEVELYDDGHFYSPDKSLDYDYKRPHRTMIRHGLLIPLPEVEAIGGGDG